MVLYLAGNFPLLNDIDKEREFMKRIVAKGREYNRLVSFYYPVTVKNVLQIKRENTLRKRNASRKNGNRLSTSKG